MAIHIRKHIIHNLLTIYRNNINTCLKKIEFYSKLDQTKLKNLQKEKLEQILIYSYLHVKYYNEIFKKINLVNEDLSLNMENFEKIPILTKDIIRDRYDDLISDEISKLKWKYNSSGGSTGEPIKLMQDENYYDWNVANKLYYKKIAGIKLGEKEMRFWGLGKDILNCPIMVQIRNIIYNRKDINIYNMSEKDLEKNLKIWNKYKPKWIEGYVQSIYEFALFIKKNNYSFVKPKGILCTAGTLCPNMKKTIEETFKCKVYNRYGSREVGDIAFGEEELILSVWNHKVEILNKSNNKESNLGNVYVTTLNNHIMPLIRYEIGDLAEKSLSWNKLKKVIGREISMFKKENGDLLDGSYFTLPIGKLPFIKRYQVIQRDYGYIEYVFTCEDKNRKLNDKEEKKVIKHVRKKLGKDCIVVFTYTEKIKTLANGKYLYTRSEVK